MREDRLKNDEVLDLLKIMAPGTALREGLDYILKARTGALIVIGDSKEILDIVDGGFFIDKEYSPSYLYELAKMDGAIVISKDLKRFLYANALLIPNPSIPTSETGTRHKTADRVAKQTSELVICVSQRRNIITLYKGSKKYIVRETHKILTRANQALQTLEKYKAVLDKEINNLNILEFEDMASLELVASAIQRTEMVMRIVVEIDKYICELGNEGRLISMQLEELIDNIEENELFIIEDYMVPRDDITSISIQSQIEELDYSQLMDLTCICSLLGYGPNVNCSELSVLPRGYRILSKLPKLPLSVIKNLVDKFYNLQGILNASIEKLDDVEGIGEVRAKAIKDGLKRIQDHILFDNRRRYTYY